MFERMPSKEKNPSESEATPDFKFYLTAIDSFLSRSDNPGRHITDEEKDASRKDQELLNKLTAEKTGGEYGGVKFEKSKYRKSAFTFLSYVSMLADNEKFKNLVSKDDLERFRTEAENLIARINELRFNDSPITKQEVDRGIKLAEEIKEILTRK